MKILKYSPVLLLLLSGLFLTGCYTSLASRVMEINILIILVIMMIIPIIIMILIQTKYTYIG